MPGPRKRSWQLVDEEESTVQEAPGCIALCKRPCLSHTQSDEIMKAVEVASPEWPQLDQ